MNVFIALNWSHECISEIMTVNVQLLKMEQYKYYKKMTIQNWTDREEYINLIWLVVNRRRGGGEKNSEWNEEGEVEMPRTEGKNNI